MSDLKIKALSQEYSELRRFLEENQQISFLNYIDNTYKKTLLLSVASYFETLVTSIILDYIKVRSNDDEKTISFVDKKALNRQYHSLFEWNKNNANKFFSFFGDNAKKKARSLIESEDLLDAERAFITIGAERNKLVHNNFATIALDNFTFEDIYKLYGSAMNFIRVIQEVLPNK